MKLNHFLLLSVLINLSLHAMQTPGDPAQLLQAVKDNDRKLVKSLLEKGIDANSADEHDQTALHWAALEKNVKIMRLLIEHGAKVNVQTEKYKQTVLHNAVGSAEAIQLLLEHGADVSLTDSNGNLPLHYAANRGNVAAANLLINRGSPVDARDNREDTPLMAAARSFRFTFINVLITKHHANVNACNKDGRTALHITLFGQWRKEHDMASTVKCLITHGALVNVRDCDGCIPLHYAARDNHVGCAQELIIAGSHIHALDDKGMSPQRYALEENNPEMIALFKKRYVAK